MSLKALGERASVHAAHVCSKAASSDQWDDDFISAFSYPESCCDSSAWRAVQRKRWTGARLIAAVPGALAMYWRAVRWGLRGGEGVSGASNMRLLSCGGSCQSAYVNYDECSIHAALSALLHLTDGGSELSGVSLAFMEAGGGKVDVDSTKKKKKRKGSDRPMDGGNITVSLDATSLRNMLLKLDALCEVHFRFLKFAVFCCNTESRLSGTPL
jgi:hypothetical protein